MTKSKARYNLDCINDMSCGSVWGTITTLEDLDEAIQQRGRFKAKIQFCGMLHDYNGKSYTFFKDETDEENYFVEI